MTNPVGVRRSDPDGQRRFVTEPRLVALEELSVAVNNQKAALAEVVRISKLYSEAELHYRRCCENANSALTKLEDAK